MLSTIAVSYAEVFAELGEIGSRLTLAKPRFVSLRLTVNDLN